jgi:putative transposon-encoded protein
MGLFMDNPTKFEVYGQEMLEKFVKKCGNSGRIYLPPDWIDKKVKIIRVD